jgi:hypothetical protein
MRKKTPSFIAEFPTCDNNCRRAGVIDSLGCGAQRLQCVSERVSAQAGSDAPIQSMAARAMPKHTEKAIEKAQDKAFWFSNYLNNSSAKVSHKLLFKDSVKES